VSVDRGDAEPGDRSGPAPAREQFVARAYALIDARTDSAAHETITRALGADGTWGTDEDVARVLLELLVVPATTANAPLPTPWAGPGRITEHASMFDLADAMGTGDLAAWQALYARASTDAAFRQQLRRATAMVDTDFASSAAVWRALLDRLPPLPAEGDATLLDGPDMALAAANRALHVAATSHRLFGVPWASWDGAQVVMTAPDALPSALDLPAMDRVYLLERGVKAYLIEVLAKRMGISRRACCAMIGASPSSVAKAIRLKRNLPLVLAERAVGVALLIEQVDRIVRESGREAAFESFDAGRWFSRWCARPCRALGNRRPAELLLTADGRAVVAQLLSQMQSAAYA